MKKRIIFAAFLLTFILCLGTFIADKGSAAENQEEETILNGVYVGPVSLGGLTKGQANEAIAKYVAGLQSRKMTIDIDGNKEEVVLTDLGLELKENDFVENAFNLGKTGNLIKRYKEKKDVEHNEIVYEPVFDLNDDKIESFLKDQCTQFDVEPKDATIKRENGKFVISEDKMGRKVSIKETAEKLKSSVLNGWDGSDLNVTAVVSDVEPKYSSKLMGRCKDVLGEFSTTYTSSSASRANNLANAARLINGTVVYPGDVFSASKKMSPITEANGYSAAGAYLNGKVVDSIGGGVCQVSTTLYNAILKAELEVVERFNHSMIVGYVEPAMDAAIAEGYKDLKFKNNTEVPIYIEVYTVGRKITFVLYGEETRDLKNREVKYVSEVIETISPGKDKVTEDPTKPSSYERVEQGAHVGYKANLWKVVYENGKEVSREKVNYSYYAPEPRYVVKGTKDKEKESPSPSPSVEPTEEPTEDPKATKEPKPKKTPKPTKTPKPAKTPKPTTPPTDDIPVDVIPTKAPTVTPKPEPTPIVTEEPEVTGPTYTIDPITE